MENLALNQNSYKKTNLLDFIQLAGNFQGLELNFASIKEALSENTKLRDIFEIINSYNLNIVNLLKLKDFSLCSDNKFKVQIIPRLKEMIDYCYRLECDLITLVPSFESRDIPQWRINRRTKEKLQELAKIAYKEDVKLGLEFVNLPNSSIPTLKEAKKVLKPLIDQENLGYVIDTFYLTKAGEKIDDLNDILKSAAQIFMIQLADVKMNNTQRAFKIKDKQRLLPGMGKFDFKELFESVYRNGYRGYYSIELHRKSLDYKIYYQFVKQIRALYQN